MKRFLALSLVVALVGLGVPTTAVAAPRLNAGVAGVAKDGAGQPLANVAVRLRSLSSGLLAGSSRTSAAGGFAFENVVPGSYIVETLDVAGRVMAASAAVNLTAGATVSGVSVTSTAAMGARAGGGAAGGSALTSTKGLLIIGGLVAAGAGYGIYQLTKSDTPASPSK